MADPIKETKEILADFLYFLKIKIFKIKKLRHNMGNVDTDKVYMVYVQDHIQ